MKTALHTQNPLPIFLQARQGRWLLWPWLVVFGLFWLFPMGHAVSLSLTDFNPLRSDHTVFVGLGNYARLGQDEIFLKALSNTLFFTVFTLPATTLLALILAHLLFTGPRGSQFFESLLLFPVMVSMVVIALLFKFAYAPQGPLNSGLMSLGLPAVGWLNDPRFALKSIMAMDVWAAMGYYALIFLTALRQISPSLFESARLDGAGPWLVMRTITLPALKPILLFVVVINGIRSLQLFTEVLTMTDGGPQNATLSLVLLMYKTGFRHMDMGYAAAQAFALVALSGVFSALQWALLRQKGGAP